VRNSVFGGPRAARNIFAPSSMTRIPALSGVRFGLRSVAGRMAMTAAVVLLVAATDAVASPWWGRGASDLGAMKEPPALESPLARDHPLVGRIFDVRHARFVTSAEMLATFSRVRLLLLGEQHDNVDHHRLQAWLIGAISSGGRRPRVVFEMIDTDKQGDVDRSLQASPYGVDQLGSALEWQKSGWPPFEIYRPVFEAAVSWQLPIVAAGLSRKRLAAADFSAAENAAGDDPALARPLPARVRAAMAAEIGDSHCGYAPESMIAPMITVQRRRDLAMARALLAGGRSAAEGALLIAGFGHARSDYGVPMVLHDLDPSVSVRSLAILEVQPGAEEPADYAESLRAETLPFDYVWFTPRGKDDDPCEEFRQQLEEMRGKRG